MGILIDRHLISSHLISMTEWSWRSTAMYLCFAKNPSYFDFIPLEEAMWLTALFLGMRRRHWQFYAALRGLTLRRRPRWILLPRSLPGSLTPLFPSSI